MKLVETQLAARLRLGERRRDRRAGGGRRAPYPYREGLWELLITALYRAGRQADALAAYQRVRARLADELGLEPGPRLQQLEQQILDARPGALRRRRAGREPAVAVGRARRARGGDRRAVASLLERRRLVEVVGPGGIGKTARRDRDRRATLAPGGVWLVRLEAATTRRRGRSTR